MTLLTDRDKAWMTAYLLSMINADKEERVRIAAKANERFDLESWQIAELIEGLTK